MTNDEQSAQDARARAEALFTITPNSSAGQDQGNTGQSAEAEKIARLRALRLAKEEAERAAKTGRRRPGRK